MSTVEEQIHRALVRTAHRRLPDAAEIAALVREADPLRRPEQVERSVDAILARLDGLGPLEPLLRAFEWRLLDELGYGFALDIDLHGAPIAVTRAASGLTTCKECARADTHSVAWADKLMCRMCFMRLELVRCRAAGCASE